MTIDEAAKRRKDFDDAIEKVRGYRRLEKNWDSYGSDPATERSVQFVVDLLTRVRDATDIPVPYPAPAGCGIFLEWYLSPETSFYFEVEGDAVGHYMKVGGVVITNSDDTEYSVDRAVGLARDFHGRIV